MIELVPARLTHVGPIANRMRAADREETQAMGRTPKGALRRGLQASVHCFTALRDGCPEAMMGLVPTNILEGEGTPWMLGSDAIYDHPREMLRGGPALVALYRDSTPNLSNLVGKGNARAIRFLRRLGFTVGEEVDVIGGVEFVTFSIGSRDV